MSLANIGLLSIAEIFGDTQFKLFARGGTSANFAGGLAGYVAIIYYLIKSLKTGNILWVNGMWDGVSAIVESLFAFFILRERLNTAGQYWGLGFIIVGLFMMHKGGIAK
jgi:multidrug transporter EmrE-like cation transporter